MNEQVRCRDGAASPHFSTDATVFLSLHHVNVLGVPGNTPYSLCNLLLRLWRAFSTLRDLGVFHVED